MKVASSAAGQSHLNSEIGLALSNQRTCLIVCLLEGDNPGLAACSLVWLNHEKGGNKYTKNTCCILTHAEARRPREEREKGERSGTYPPIALTIKACYLIKQYAPYYLAQLGMCGYVPV